MSYNIDQSTNDRLKSQIHFAVEVDKLKQVFRQSYITDGTRRENDAEHSWHLALLAMILQEYAEPNIDLLRVLKMALVHDIVEIITGDTFVYDTASRKLAADREALAAEKVFSMLPDPQGSEFHALWLEFEARKTKEAKYARALDRMQPILLNYTAHGKTWREHGVTLEAVLKLNIPIIADASPALAEFTETMLRDAASQGHIKL